VIAIPTLISDHLPDFKELLFARASSYIRMSDRREV